MKCRYFIFEKIYKKTSVVNNEAEEENEIKDGKWSENCHRPSSGINCLDGMTIKGIKKETTSRSMAIKLGFYSMTMILETAFIVVKTFSSFHSLKRDEINEINDNVDDELMNWTSNFQPHSVRVLCRLSSHVSRGTTLDFQQTILLI